MAQLTPTSVFKSASGLEMPVLGLGTWQATGNEVENAVDSALEAGYSLIDTAFIYGNEEVIGNVLSKWFSSGKLKRKDIFITTKLPFTANNPSLVREHFDKSLKALQVDYVDLYLIHNAVGFLPGSVTRNADGGVDWSSLKFDMTTDHVAIWKEMEKLVDAGLTKAVGLSNFNVRQIDRVLKNARIPPANLQIQIYLYHQDKETVEFCKSKGITVTSYSTLGSPGGPQSYKDEKSKNPLIDPVVLRIAEAHGKVPAQVLLRHMLQLGIAVIPKSANAERIRQNLQLFDFQLSESEMAELNALDRGKEGCLFNFEHFKAHPEYPY